MKDIKEILKANGVEADKLDSIVDSIQKDHIGEGYVSKKQYSKKVAQIDELNNKVADLEATSSNDTSKAELETVKAEFEAYKNNIETEKVNGTKKSKLTELLKKEGANEKLVGLLLKEFDLEKIEIDGDNIKDWDNVIKPVKEGYSDCFAKVETVGNPPATPPKGNPTQKYTLESIKGMTTEQIKQNYEAIKNDLASR